MSDLRKAAQAVLDRWDGPKWDWLDAGPTADLMKDLRSALAKMPDLRKAAEIALDALEEINKLSVGANAVSLPAEIDTAMDALRAALAKCNYPNCVDNSPDGKCTRWLLAECEKSEDYQR